jgi:hypothetical protein
MSVYKATWRLAITILLDDPGRMVCADLGLMFEPLVRRAQVACPSLAKMLIGARLSSLELNNKN